MKNYLQVANEAVKIGAEILQNEKYHFQKYMEKSDKDPVTDMDIKIENEIKEFLRKSTSDIKFLGEEENGQFDIDDKYWVLDPIDGTANFSRGIPIFTISLALLCRGIANVGVVHYPHLKETYSAEAGKGAFLNGRKIQVSNRKKLRDSIIGFGDFTTGESAEIKVHNALAAHVFRMRLIGTAALQMAWVASGRLDIGVTLSNHIWDIQAGVLLVREAGGAVYDIDGSEHSVNSRCTIASNQHLKSVIIERISEYSDYFA